MLQERVEVAGPPAEAQSPLADDRAHVLTLLSRLEASPHDEALATGFNRAVVELAKHPSVEVFELLRELAERPWLTHARDVHGWPCRAAVLWSWAELGYPWALELSAEDLAYVRENAHGSAGGWLTLTFALSAISAVLNGAAFLFILVALLASSSFEVLSLLVPAPFGGLLAHALATLAATNAAKARTPSAAGRLKTLSYAAWLILVPAVLMGVLSIEVGAVLFIVGLPLLASSVSAGVAARGLLKR